MINFYQEEFYQIYHLKGTNFKIPFHKFRIWTAGFSNALLFCEWSIGYVVLGKSLSFQKGKKNQQILDFKTRSHGHFFYGDTETFWGYIIIFTVSKDLL